mmetsp:Transcript_708/g.1106  ORF Transcript_708/g.1106 Transcript_708/m.1106 type:complete len:481 (+) Transcript_708:43-1485(+)
MKLITTSCWLLIKSIFASATIITICFTLIAVFVHDFFVPIQNDGLASNSTNTGIHAVSIANGNLFNGYGIEMTSNGNYNRDPTEYLKMIDNGNKIFRLTVATLNSPPVLNYALMNTNFNIYNSGEIKLLGVEHNNIRVLQVTNVLFNEKESKIYISISVNYMVSTRFYNSIYIVSAKVMNSGYLVSIVVTPVLEEKLSNDGDVAVTISAFSNPSKRFVFYQHVLPVSGISISIFDSVNVEILNKPIPQINAFGSLSETNNDDLQYESVYAGNWVIYITNTDQIHIDTLYHVVETKTPLPGYNNSFISIFNSGTPLYFKLINDECHKSIQLDARFDGSHATLYTSDKYQFVYTFDTGKKLQKLYYINVMNAEKCMINVVKVLTLPKDPDHPLTVLVGKNGRLVKVFKDTFENDYVHGGPQIVGINLEDQNGYVSNGIIDRDSAVPTEYYACYNGSIVETQLQTCPTQIGRSISRKAMLLDL